MRLSILYLNSRLFTRAYKDCITVEAGLITRVCIFVYSLLIDREKRNDDDDAKRRQNKRQVSQAISGGDRGKRQAKYRILIPEKMYSTCSEFQPG